MAMGEGERLVLVWLKRAGAAAALAGVAACVGTTAEGERLTEMPTFQVGYNDGCVTANEENKSFSTKTARDDYLFDNDEAYRAGWRQGYLECRSRRRDADNGGRILGERGDDF